MGLFSKPQLLEAQASLTKLTADLEALQGAHATTLESLSAALAEKEILSASIKDLSDKLTAKEAEMALALTAKDAEVAGKVQEASMKGAIDIVADMGMAPIAKVSPSAATEPQSLAEFDSTYATLSGAAAFSFFQKHYARLRGAGK